MPSVELSRELIARACEESKRSNRSTSAQIEHWAKIGQLAEANPKLTHNFIKDIQVGMREDEV